MMNHGMNSSDEAERRRQALSDLADGRADARQLQALLKDWERDDSLRHEWQSLHLIGAALRSPDLAAPVQSSEALLATLRERIAREPVPLRPRRLQDWLPALGVAAGFVLMALLLPSLPLPASRPFPTVAQVPASPDLSKVLVTPPMSQALDGDPSFVQTIVAPEAPGLVTEPSAQQARLRADPASAPHPLAHAASGGMP
jgi:hypothetical protein